MSVSYDDPRGLLLEAISKISQSRYAMAGSYCLAVYEWLIMFDSEVDLIHTVPWSIVKFAYLLCRYYPITIVWPILFWAYLGEFDRETCSRMLYPTQVLLVPIVLPAQVVMAVRAYAFSGRDRRVLGLFIVSFAIAIAGLIWTLASRTLPPPSLFYLIMGKSGCFPTSAGSARAFNFRVAFGMLSSILIDTLCLAVILWHCRGNIWAAASITSRQTLLHKFVHQGLIYYTTILVLNIAAAVIYFLPQRIPNQLGLPYALIVTNVMACRIVLELRETASNRDPFPSLRLPNSTTGTTTVDQHE